MPALFTSTSSRPNSSSDVDTARSAMADVETSPTTIAGVRAERTNFVDGRGGAVLVEVDDHDPGTLTGEANRGRATEARTPRP